MSGISASNDEAGPSYRNPRLSLADSTTTITHHQSEEDPPFSPRQPLSPATIVHLKQTFSKAAQHARSRSAGLADWEGVRTPHVQAPSDRQSALNLSSDAPRAAAGSRLGSLLSPPLVDEPTSYVQLNGSAKLGSATGIEVESSSDDSHSGDEYTRSKPTRTAKSKWLIPSLTAQQRGILKCSIAYTVATLFTFVPVLSGLLAAPFDLEGPVRGGHVVATVATYYNPAKTLGAMFEAVRQTFLIAWLEVCLAEARIPLFTGYIHAMGFPVRLSGGSSIYGYFNYPQQFRPAYGFSRHQRTRVNGSDGTGGLDESEGVPPSIW